jgi:hypothetical protein
MFIALRHAGAALKARYTPPACRLLSVSAKHDALVRIDVCKYPRQGRACGKGARLDDQILHSGYG